MRFNVPSYINLAIINDHSQGGRGGGGEGGRGELYRFPPTFLTHFACQYGVTVKGKNPRSLVKISKGYDSYLDERGRRKATKLANNAIYKISEIVRVI